MEKALGDYSLSWDKSKLDLNVIHAFLVDAYWCKGIPKEVVTRSIENSLCLGVYKGAEQVGFARVITDYATFMYIGDVFVLEAHRGNGLGVAMMDTVMNYPDLQGIRTWTLFTADAHRLYEKFGFEVVEGNRAMRRKVPNPYKLDNYSS